MISLICRNISNKEGVPAARPYRIHTFSAFTRPFQLPNNLFRPYHTFSIVLYPANTRRASIFSVFSEMRIRLKGKNKFSSTPGVQGFANFSVFRRGVINHAPTPGNVLLIPFAIVAHCTAGHRIQLHTSASVPYYRRSPRIIMDILSCNKQTTSIYLCSTLTYPTDNYATRPPQKVSSK